MIRESIFPIIVEKENASDSEYIITEILRSEGDAVKKGDPIISYESSKTIIEVDAPSDGYVFYNTEKGATISIGNCIAAVAREKKLPDNYFKEYKSDKSINVGEQPPLQRISNAAQKLLSKYNISTEVFSGYSVISKAHVEEYIENKRNIVTATDLALPSMNKVIIIGAGTGAVLLKDLILKTPFMDCVGICDDKLNLQGQKIWGMNVVGTLKDLEKLFKSKVYDSAIISVTSLPSRANIFNKLKKLNIPLINLVDPTVSIGTEAIMGEGNIILGHGRIGPYSIMGNNNFLSAYVNFEHHCKLGNHCTFGPSVYMSGGVEIGSSVLFGTGISIEPNIKIGDNAVIASGLTITRSVEKNSSLKRKG